MNDKTILFLIFWIPSLLFTYNYLPEAYKRTVFNKEKITPLACLITDVSLDRNKGRDNKSVGNPYLSLTNSCDIMLRVYVSDMNVAYKPPLTNQKVWLYCDKGNPTIIYLIEAADAEKNVIAHYEQTYISVVSAAILTLLLSIVLPLLWFFFLRK